jgi:hypothetical protein
MGAVWLGCPNLELGLGFSVPDELHITIEQAIIHTQQNG